MIDLHSGVPRHRQLAAALRARITTGEWSPGTLLPSETRLSQEYEVGRGTVRRAVAMLRADGLVDVASGRGTRVRQPAEREVLTPDPGSIADVRMPTPEERAELDMAEGVPLIVVTDPTGWVEVYPGDQYRLRFM